MPRKLHLSLGLTAVLVLALSACAPADDAAALTLASTKSPVQLLRNEAASRLPDTLPPESFSTKDGSVACRSEDEDPAGLLRQWQSSAAVPVGVGQGPAIAADLAASFAAEDWELTVSANEAALYRSVLTRSGSTASIHVDATASNVEVWSNGPCVTTAGATSSEVTSLE